MNEDLKDFMLFIIVSTHIMLLLMSSYNISIWADEVFGYVIPQLGTEQIVNVLKQDGHPPLYYILLSGYLKWGGNSESMLRFSSIIVSAFSLLAIYLLFSYISNKKIALLTTFLYSLSPLVIFWGGMYRYYTLLVLLVTLNVFFFLKYEKEKKKLYLIFYAITGIVMVYINYLPLFVLIANGVWYLAKVFDKENVKDFLIVSIIMVLVLSPLFINLLSNQIPHLLYSSHVKDRSEVGIPTADLQTNLFVKVPVLFFTFVYGSTVFYWDIVLLLIAFIYIPLILLRGAKGLFLKHNYLLWLFLSVIIMTLFATTYIWKYKAVWIPIRLMFMLPIFMFFIAYSVWKFNYSGVRIMAVTLILVLFIGSSYNYFNSNKVNKGFIEHAYLIDWKLINQQVKWNTNKVVIFGTQVDFHPLYYYHSGWHKGSKHNFEYINPTLAKKEGHHWIKPAMDKDNFYYFDQKKGIPQAFYQAINKSNVTIYYIRKVAEATSNKTDLIFEQWLNEKYLKINEQYYVKEDKTTQAWKKFLFNSDYEQYKIKMLTYKT